MKNVCLLILFSLFGPGCTSVPICLQSYNPNALANIEESFSQTQAALREKGNGFETIEELADPPLLKVLWTQVADWVLLYLECHPDTIEEELAEQIQNQLKLQASILKFQQKSKPGFIIAVSDGLAGTFFIITKSQAGCFKVDWQMKDLVAQHVASDDFIGRWAGATQQWRPGLFPELGFLPAASKGHQRFYLATWYYSQGATGTVQLIVWEWDGKAASPLIAGEYNLMIDGVHAAITVKNDLLTLNTKEHFKTFFTNGASEEPRGVWSIRIGQDQVENLGRRFIVSELQFLDQLFYRVQRRQDINTMASPQVVDYLLNLIPDASKRLINKKLDYETLGEMWGWRKAPIPHGCWFCLDVDNLGPLEYKIEYRNGSPFVVDIQEPIVRKAVEVTHTNQSTDPYVSKCRYSE